MLRLLVCSDVHTYTDNIRLAIKKAGRVDAVLIAGDLEAEKELVLAAAGDIPVYMVCGNNDYYLNTEYPQELLIDIGPDTVDKEGLRIEETGADEACLTIKNVTDLLYDSVPRETWDSGSGSGLSLSRRISNFFFAPQARLARGLSFLFHTFHTVKKPPEIHYRILLTHGDKYNVPDLSLLTRRAGILDADLVVFGHTHRFVDKSAPIGRLRFLNPGCLLGDPASSFRTLGGYEICSFGVLQMGAREDLSFLQMSLKTL